MARLKGTGIVTVSIGGEDHSSYVMNAEIVADAVLYESLVLKDATPQRSLDYYNWTATFEAVIDGDSALSNIIDTLIGGGTATFILNTDSAGPTYTGPVLLAQGRHSIRQRGDQSIAVQASGCGDLVVS